METPTPNRPSHLGEATRYVARQSFTILENRFQLLMLELAEERDRVLLAIWLALGMATFALLAGIAFTVIIAVALWAYSPILALLVLMLVYGITAALLYARLARLQRDWQAFPGTLEQLKKDRACLEQNFN